MKAEYDFSKGQRGKFFFPDSDFNLPIYLNKTNREFILKKVEKVGISPQDLVNRVLEKEIELLKDLA